MNFSDSFIREVPITPGEPCHWRRHFRGALGQVITYLDAQARRNPTRFVFVFMDTLAKGTAARGRKKPYSKAAVEKAAAYLQLQGIIVRVPDMTLDGRRYHGFFVAQHDHACKDSGDAMCRFVCGPLELDPPGTRHIVKTLGRGKPFSHTALYKP